MHPSCAHTPNNTNTNICVLFLFPGMCAWDSWDGLVHMKPWRYWTGSGSERNGCIFAIGVLWLGSENMRMIGDGYRSFGL